DLAIDFAADKAAEGATDLVVDRLVRNDSRGERFYVDRTGALVSTRGPRINGQGALMTIDYVNPIGEQSQFFELTGGTAWYTTFFDRELQNVAAPDGSPQTVHCSMDRDSRSTMTSNDFGVSATGSGQTYTMSCWLRKDPTQPGGVVPFAVVTGPNSRDLYWVGPVTDEWQWFHVTFEDPPAGDGAIGFSRDGADVIGFEEPVTGGLRFFHAWGFELRTGGIPNSYGGLEGNALDRLRLAGPALAAAQSFTDGTLTVRGTGGGGNAEILSEAATDGVRLGFIAGELAVKSAAGTVLTGVTPAAGETWELEADFSGTSVTVTGSAQGAAGSPATGAVSARDGSLEFLARSSEKSGEELDMALERLVIEPS
ncbi:MAG: hypothetical protein AAFY81_06125, partial [Pseudomonadota bacterium]